MCPALISSRGPTRMRSPPLARPPVDDDGVRRRINLAPFLSCMHASARQPPPTHGHGPPFASCNPPFFFSPGMIKRERAAAAAAVADGEKACVDTCHARNHQRRR